MTDILETLPEPEVPFPVEPAPRIRADLHRLGTVVNGTLETGHFRFDCESPAYRVCKIELLEAGAERCRCLETDDPDGLGLALERVLEVIRLEKPDVTPKIEWGWNLERIANEIALRVPEDMVIVRARTVPVPS